MAPTAGNLALLAVDAKHVYTRLVMELEAALLEASDYVGLQDYYRDMVRPLLWMPREQWPGCCGGGCEPCAVQLVMVAERVLYLLGRDEPLTR